MLERAIHAGLLTTAYNELVAEETGLAPRYVGKIAGKDTRYNPELYHKDLREFRLILKLIKEHKLKVSRATDLVGWNRAKFWDTVWIEAQAIEEDVICIKVIQDKLSKSSRRRRARVRRGPNWKVARESTYQAVMAKASEIQSPTSKKKAKKGAIPGFASSKSEHGL